MIIRPGALYIPRKLAALNRSCCSSRSFQKKRKVHLIVPNETHINFTIKFVVYQYAAHNISIEFDFGAPSSIKFFNDLLEQFYVDLLRLIEI